MQALKIPKMVEQAMNVMCVFAEGALLRIPNDPKNLYFEDQKMAD